ncbi:acyltransferase family protein [Nesterenkonia sp. PF2B19]|uniref:acyltransferase family protein n=1 Tax=Nesterenkonia sp. PF2B19 TaxID=1881858 RepID=UPI000871F288|nr:acyltransferase family protein [Nesterenkonia sp. PF2B19]
MDLLRVISVAAVVIGHAYPGMPGEEYLQIWRMPLFFFLAGFFFSTSRTFSGEVAVRWRTLATPYLTWFLILLGAVWAMEHTPWPFGEYVISGALAGGASTDMPFLAFWFISVMFFAALLLRILVALPGGWASSSRWWASPWRRSRSPGWPIPCWASDWCRRAPPTCWPATGSAAISGGSPAPCR